MYPLCGMVSHPTTALCLKQHDILSTLHNLDYKGPTEEGYVGASTTGNCYVYLDYNPKHTYMLGGNTSAHTCRRITHLHTHVLGVTQQHTHTYVQEDNTSAHTCRKLTHQHTHMLGDTHQYTHVLVGILHQHTHLSEDNTSAHTHAGNLHISIHVLESNTLAHTRYGGNTSAHTYAGG